MKPRLHFASAAPDALKAMRALSAYVDGCGLDRRLLELVKIRASQINGCAFCLDMHIRDARAAGERDERLFLLEAWREAPVYSERERAALAWTEALTRLDGGVPDAVYEATRAQFTEAETAKLSVAIGLMRVIPISSSGGPRIILRALRSAGQALDDGEIVCIFPEGQITRTGTLLPFRRGFERIVKGRTVPIIPVHLDRVWGSIASFVKGRFIWKLPEQIPYPVTVSFGAPQPAETPAHEIRRLVRELGEAA